MEEITNPGSAEPKPTPATAPAETPPLPDILGMILGGLPKPAPAVKQQRTPRDKQQRGGKRK